MAISEWDQRQLCSDGGCVGVIGPDGTCKTCGRVAPDWGDERRRGLVADAAAAEDGADGDGGAGGDGGADGEDELAPSAPAALGELAEWQRRRLCPDGACIGLIGPDGTCKVCGTPATGAAASAAAEEDEEAEYEDEDGDEEDEGAEDAEGAEESSAAEEDDDAEDGDEADEADGEEEADDGDGGDRKLCPDGACIGVIGPDGRCKICGKEAA